MKIIEVDFPSRSTRRLEWLFGLVCLFLSIFSVNVTEGFSVREFSFPSLIFFGLALTLLYNASVHHRVVFSDGHIEFQSSIVGLLYRRSGVFLLNSFSGVRSVTFYGRFPNVAVELFNKDGHYLILRVLTLAGGNNDITISNRQSLAQYFSLPDCGHFPDLVRFSAGFSTTKLRVRWADQEGYK